MDNGALFYNPQRPRKMKAQNKNILFLDNQAFQVLSVCVADYFKRPNQGLSLCGLSTPRAATVTSQIVCFVILVTCQEKTTQRILSPATRESHCSVCKDISGIADRMWVGLLLLQPNLILIHRRVSRGLSYGYTVCDLLFVHG